MGWPPLPGFPGVRWPGSCGLREQPRLRCRVLYTGPSTVFFLNLIDIFFSSFDFVCVLLFLVACFNIEDRESVEQLLSNHCGLRKL